MNLFGAKTVKGILANIYKQIDELEKVAEQQEVVAKQRSAQIDELASERAQAWAEQDHAEKVASKLRSLVEPVNG